jgi:hypothetical protein
VAIAFAGRTLPEVAKPAKISVRARLKQENLDFLNGRSMTALGDDLSDNAATGAPQYIQFVETRHPNGEIEILAFVGNRQPQLLVGRKARHLSL